MSKLGLDTQKWVHDSDHVPNYVGKKITKNVSKVVYGHLDVEKKKSLSVVIETSDYGYEDFGTLDKGQEISAEYLDSNSKVWIAFTNDSIIFEKLRLYSVDSIFKNGGVFSNLLSRLYQRLAPLLNRKVAF